MVAVDDVVANIHVTVLCFFSLIRGFLVLKGQLLSRIFLCCCKQEVTVFQSQRQWSELPQILSAVSPVRVKGASNNVCKERLFGFKKIFCFCLLKKKKNSLKDCIWDRLCSIDFVTRLLSLFSCSD